MNIDILSSEQTIIMDTYAFISYIIDNTTENNPLPINLIVRYTSDSLSLLLFVVISPNNTLIDAVKHKALIYIQTTDELNIILLLANIKVFPPMIANNNDTNSNIFLFLSAKKPKGY